MTWINKIIGMFENKFLPKRTYFLIDVERF